MSGVRGGKEGEELEDSCFIENSIQRYIRAFFLRSETARLRVLFEKNLLRGVCDRPNCHPMARASILDARPADMGENAVVLGCASCTVRWCRLRPETSCCHWSRSRSQMSARCIPQRPPRQNLHWVRRSNAERWPIPPSSFSAIICIHFAMVILRFV